MRHGEQWLDDPVEWGRQLIASEDHDPLYSGLWRWMEAGEDPNRIRRFMLAYWCCYSVGASWFISRHETVVFWNYLSQAARNVESPRSFNAAPLDRWPRAHERRHWRGQKCIDSVEWLRHNFTHPEQAVLTLEHPAGEPVLCLASVEREVTRWPQFGPWIAFKAADMLERVLGCDVQFPNSVMKMYRDPRRGAEMAGEVLDLTPEEVTQHMLDSYSDMAAPPNGSRRVNVQEVETVLCKWKSARNGKYWIGADTRSHLEELELWGAQDLYDCYPREPG